MRLDVFALYLQVGRQFAFGDAQRSFDDPEGADLLRMGETPVHRLDLRLQIRDLPLQSPVRLLFIQRDKDAFTGQQ